MSSHWIVSRHEMATLAKSRLSRTGGSHVSLSVGGCLLRCDWLFTVGVIPALEIIRHFNVSSPVVKKTVSSIGISAPVWCRSQCFFVPSLQSCGDTLHVHNCAYDAVVFLFFFLLVVAFVIVKASWCCVVLDVQLAGRIFFGKTRIWFPR